METNNMYKFHHNIMKHNGGDSAFASTYRWTVLNKTALRSVEHQGMQGTFKTGLRNLIIFDVLSIN